MRKEFTLFAIGGMTLLGAGCLKKEEYPNVPRLEYIGTVLNLNPASATDSVAYVSFRFTDGDGDLGLSPGDTLGDFHKDSMYYHNIFVRYFEKQNGQYVEYVPVFPFHSRFGNLTPTGGDKSLQGIMDVGVFANPASLFDTVRYEIFIVDRALNHSDTITTEDIVLPL